MRRFDKKQNIDKVNLLIENNYFSSVGGMSVSQLDIKNLVDAMHSLHEILNDSVLLKLLNEEQIKALHAAHQVCVHMDMRIMSGK